MAQSPIGLALEFLSRFSESETVDKMGLREPAKKLLYHGMRTSVKAGAMAQSQFKTIKKLLPGQQLARVKSSQASPFDLTLTEEQELVRDTLHQFALQNMRPVAQEADRQRKIPEGYLAQCQEIGITLMAIPEAIDGAGNTRSPLSNTLLAEDMSWGDMSLALVPLASLGFVNALTEFGSVAQQTHYLPAFTEEAFVGGCLALMEPKIRFDYSQLETRASPQRESYTLNGIKTMVPLGAQNKVVLVFAKVPGKGSRGFIVETNAPGVFWEEERHMGLKALGLSRLILKDVTVPKNAMLGEEEVEYDHQRMIDLSRIGTCALALGTCQAVLDYVTQYCNDRVAFGEPISNRQAVAFMIADIAIELEGMRLLTYRAASRAEQGLDFHKEAFLAHLQCCERSMEIGTNGVQLLGGHGFVCEHPLEMWYRQLRAIGILDGIFLV
ncbi:acyl-CoA dehydrogenase family protein [Deltaproteobacteria bacterium TL4]